MSTNYPRRAWVNAPSGLQPAHRFHGMLGVVVHDSANACRFYPSTGAVESMRLGWNDISFGWPEHLVKQTALERKIAAAKDVLHQIMGHDVAMNADPDPRAPTGDDYNDVIVFVAAVHKALS